MKHKETLSAREFLSLKEPRHFNIFTLNDLSLAHVYLHKICSEKSRWNYDLSEGFGVVSVDQLQVKLCGVALATDRKLGVPLLLTKIVSTC